MLIYHNVLFKITFKILGNKIKTAKEEKKKRILSSNKRTFEGGILLPFPIPSLIILIWTVDFSDLSRKQAGWSLNEDGANLMEKKGKRVDLRKNI